MVSWIGKGIRGSLRDAMLSESVPAEMRGKAFGFHRAGDTVGAIIGPLFGAFLLQYLPHVPADFAFRRIFLISLIPGLLAPLAFFLMVQETRKVAKPQLSIWSALRQLPLPFRRFLVAVGLFGSGDFSPTLLIMAAATLLAPRFGAVRAAELAALFYVLRNIVYAGASYPIGALSDRFSKRKLLAMGFAAAGLTSAGVAVMFVLHSANLFAIAGLFLLSGVFASAQDTLEGSIPPDITPPEIRGTVYGALGLVNGAGDFVASALLGTLWSLVSPIAGFAVAAVLMIAGAIAVI